jgi:hypothetical protein
MRVENPRLSVALDFFCLKYGVARRDVVPWYGFAAVYIPYVVHTAAVFYLLEFLPNLPYVLSSRV